MSKFDEKYFINDFPSSIATLDDVHRLLQAPVDHGAADLFITTNDYPTIQVNGRNKVILERKLNHTEVTFIAMKLAGKSAETALNSSECLNYAVSLPTGERRKFYRFRGNAISAQVELERGFRITLRKIETSPLPLEAIAMEDDIVTAMHQFDKGLVFFVGGTGTGKSTSLSSLIDSKARLEDSNMNLICVESPIETIYDQSEYPSSLVLQLEPHGKHVGTYVEAVENTLRMKSSHTLIGEARSAAEIEVALYAANTGQGVFTTLHANNLSTAIRRMIAMFEPNKKSLAQYDIIDLGYMFVAQDLIPTVDGKRVAIREYLINNDDIRENLREAKNIGPAMSEAIAQYGVSFVTSAREKLEQGIISEETFNRVRIRNEGAKNGG